MIEIQWDPEKKQLRQFAGIWIICGVQAVVGVLHPPAIRPVFVGLILITFPIGWVVSHVLLGGIFYLLFTPIGLVLRMTGHDPLQLKPPQGNSLWKTPVGKADPASYLRQS
jgi:hypothetical protein